MAYVKDPVSVRLAGGPADTSEIFSIGLDVQNFDSSIVGETVASVNWGAGGDINIAYDGEASARFEFLVDLEPLGFEGERHYFCTSFGDDRCEQNNSGVFAANVPFTRNPAGANLNISRVFDSETLQISDGFLQFETKEAIEEIWFEIEGFASSGRRAVRPIPASEPGIIVRVVDSARTIDSQTAAFNVFDAAEINDISEDVFPFIDFGNCDGTFLDTQDYGIDLASDFVIQAWTDVTIPMGEWGLACGSDDGCLIEINPKDGSDFEWNLGKFNEDGTNIPANQIRFEGNRGHGWTLGGFELDEPLEATLFVQMHERAGCDSFEIAVTDIAPFEGDTVTDGDWFVLGGDEGIDFDEIFDWNLRVPDLVPAVVFNVGPGQVIIGRAEDVVEIEVGEFVVTEATFVATLNGDFPYEFEINESGTFDSIEVARPLEVATTELQMNNATINVVANGDLSGLEGEFQLLIADKLSGGFTVNLSEGVVADTSRFASEGILIFGDAHLPGIPGDIDGDGTISFSDFLILSANFGMRVDVGTRGDIDGDGEAGFPDLLVLSANFGRSGGATVPEPSAVLLLLLGVLASVGFYRCPPRFRRSNSPANRT